MIKKSMAVILAFISILGMNLNLDMNLKIENSFSGNEISIIIVFVAFIFLIYKAIQSEDKRLNIISVILGFIFASFEVIGNSIVNYGNLTGILYNSRTILKSIIKFSFYLIIISSIIKILFFYLKNSIKVSERKECKFFTNNKRSIFIVSAVLLVAWLPYFLKYFPGIVGFDTLDQLKQAVGEKPFWNGSPICTTLTLKLIIDLTMPIFNNMTISIAICTILKMIFMAFVISFALKYLSKKNVDPRIRLLILLFFILNPAISLYSISLEKDSLFATMLLADFILLFEFATNTEEFVKSKIKILVSFLFIVLTTIVRHNGMYIYILLIPFLYIILRKKYIKLSVFIIGTLICVKLINTTMFAIFDVANNSSTGFLCVPMQAMARLVTLNDINLTEEEKHEINLFVEYDELPGSYNPSLSDPEMGHFRTEYLESHKMQYLLLNVKLFVRYPHFYIESLMCNTSGYWFPEKHKNIFDKGVIVNELGIEEKTLIKSSV